MNRNILLLTVILLVILFTSCKSQKTSYFQDLDISLKNVLIELDSKAIKETAIRPKDELVIVISSVDPDAAIPFNLYSREGRLSSSSGAQSSASMSDDRKFVTYQVDNLGYVNLPTLGKVELAGLTIDEAILHLEEVLKKYITSPIVNIQISNFRVSVLGAVVAPGSFYFSERQVSVLDAIASAKDLLPQARRDNILLIRTHNDKKEFVRFDITNSNMITSPYFYLQQNDVLYIEPNKAIQQDASMNQRKQYNLTIITSVVSTALSAFSLIIAVSKK